MELELTNFFFGVAVALFISILAWSDLLKKPREDLLKLEERYIEHLGKKKKSVLPLIRPYSSYTFKEQMSAILDIWADKKIEGSDIELSKEIKNLHGIRKKLEVKYSIRYIGALLLTIVSFIFGVLSELIGNLSWKFIFGNLTVVNNWLFLSLFFILIFCSLLNSFLIYFDENKFAKVLFESLDKTGV